ncbi:MAG: flagellar biosynthesis protein FliQ [Rhodothalassiaceae bacterium]
MNGAEILDVGRDAITVLLVVAGPIMAVGLGVGLIISLFQALTQIQEMTLTFVPKIFAIFLSLLLFLPMMGEAMYGLMMRLMERVATGG